MRSLLFPLLILGLFLQSCSDSSTSPTPVRRDPIEEEKKGEKEAKKPGEVEDKKVDAALKPAKPDVDGIVKKVDPIIKKIDGAVKPKTPNSGLTAGTGGSESTGGSEEDQQDIKLFGEGKGPFGINMAVKGCKGKTSDAEQLKKCIRIARYYEGLLNCAKDALTAGTAKGFEKTKFENIVKGVEFVAGNYEAKPDELMFSVFDQVTDLGLGTIKSIAECSLNIAEGATLVVDGVKDVVKLMRDYEASNAVIGRMLAKGGNYSRFTGLAYHHGCQSAETSRIKGTFTGEITECFDGCDSWSGYTKAYDYYGIAPESEKVSKHGTLVWARETDWDRSCRHVCHVYYQLDYMNFPGAVKANAKVCHILLKQKPKLYRHLDITQEEKSNIIKALTLLSTDRYWNYVSSFSHPNYTKGKMNPNSYITRSGISKMMKEVVHPQGVVRAAWALTARKGLVMKYILTSDSEIQEYNISGFSSVELNDEVAMNAPVYTSVRYKMTRADVKRFLEEVSAYKVISK